MCESDLCFINLQKRDIILIQLSQVLLFIETGGNGRKIRKRQTLLSNSLFGLRKFVNIFAPTNIHISESYNNNRSLKNRGIIGVDMSTESN